MCKSCDAVIYVGDKFRRKLGVIKRQPSPRSAIFIAPRSAIFIAYLFAQRSRGCY